LNYIKASAQKKNEASKNLLNPQTFTVLNTLIKKELAFPAEIDKGLLPHETAIVSKVREETKQANRNNLTRTNAYLDCYERNPELHWSLLAHLVSRNGGYHMTDLKGESMNHLFGKDDQQIFFRFLEHANAAIFSDAYPQLLLYEIYKEKPFKLRKLLNIFHISRFMHPIWEMFAAEKNPPLLTAAMIINEQRMLEDRILKRTSHGEVLQRIDFQLQEFLGFTTVIFPFSYKKTAPSSLTGLTVKRFADLSNRIMTGKKLYAILFQYPEIHKGIYHFSKSIPHTGSRADYWPYIFGENKQQGKIHSPSLTEAWPDEPLPIIPMLDWFKNEDCMDDLIELPAMKKLDITETVINNLRQLQLINEIKAII
jgi:hypothetical protein